jgi:hypothetical protein
LKRAEPVVHVRVMGEVSRERLFEVYESLLRDSDLSGQSGTLVKPGVNRTYDINLPILDVTQAVEAERVSKIIETFI